MVVTYGFVMGFIGGTTTVTPQTQARITVEAVKLNSKANANITVYVKNVGTVPVKVTAVYLYSANGTLVGANTTSSAIQTLIPTEAVKPVNVTFTDVSELVSGTYYVKVTTQEGAVATSEVFTVG
ncbi:MAG: hypothetical protein ACXQTB_03785 [Candidatus Nezhaarchaeales archaeon]